jgi:UDP-4-amino-4,6-dideoxy-N-acetyl-beta-L-altrosamine transaminase
MINTIPYGRQQISQEDIDAVVGVLQSDFLTQGPVVPKFEKAVAEYTGSRYAFSVTNATSGLHLACLALGLKSGDIAWTSAVSFVASANCAKYCEAEVDFIDIDPNTYNMSISALKIKLAKAKSIGRLPTVVIPVHLTGQSCDMEEIWKLSQEYGFKIIEDASHAIGASYKSSKVGSCEFSDVTVFSFHPVKIITTGEGGMVCTNQQAVAAKIYRLRSHGITREASEMTQPSQGPWYYQQLELGYNYRMTEMQAALGLSQLKKLDEFILRRHEISNSYDVLLSELNITLPNKSSYSYSSLHLYVIRIDPEKFKLTRKEVFERLRASGVIVNLHYIPIYHHPYYSQFGYNPADFPEAEIYYKEAISLPIFPALTEDQLVYIRDTIIRPIGHQTIF